MRQLTTHALFRACGALTALLMLFVIVLSVQHEHDLVYAADVRDATVVAEVLTASTDRDVVRAAIGRTAAGRSGRLTARLSDGDTLGMSNDDPVVTLPLRAADGGNAVVSVVPGPVPLPLFTMVLTLAIALVGLAVAVPLGRRPLRPVTRALTVLTQVAREGGGRVRVHGPAELTELADAINATADRTEVLLANEREMVADISHRLRTPLTALRLNTDAIGTGDAENRVRASVDELERDVNRIIGVLRPSSTAPASQACDLAAAVTDRMTFWSAFAGAQNRSFEVRTTTETARVPLARDQIDAVVDTLLANVFQHTPPCAAVAVDVVRHAGWVTLVVEDGGPGFADPSGALRRGASGSGSTGLGLDIARTAVESTGGRIVVDKGRLGGARVRLRMAEAGRKECPEDPRAWRLWSKTHLRPT
ncbi:HAMP domain-containing sensor histidine kinase [Lentzea sp. NPDC006480]|uniref:sensor histidine kinase n=1 Tax=Lentzea sp. NPDC006480 TaxID=3157176 RepID=UPI0033AE724D